MAKKNPARPARKKGKPSKPPQATGGGGAAMDGVTSFNMDSGLENFSAMIESSCQSEAPADPLADWKARKEKLRAARDALWKLPESEYESIIREMIHTAPSAWHLRKLVQEVIRRLQWLSRGSGDHRMGIPENDEGVIGRVHYQIARITRDFNVALTAKSTPQWLLKAKEHPEFKRAWKEFSRTKGEHERNEANARVIEVEAHGGQMGLLKLRCAFGEKVVRMEWRRGPEVMRQETRHRISSNGVLQFWLGDVLKEFDEWMDSPGGPLSEDWAKRWADEDLYLMHFMPHAEREWNPAKLDELQVHACGLLTTNNGRDDGKPRYDFDAFKTRIRRLALRQIRLWRDQIVPPAPKVSRK